MRLGESYFESNCRRTHRDQSNKPFSVIYRASNVSTAICQTWIRHASTETKQTNESWDGIAFECLVSTMFIKWSFNLYALSGHTSIKEVEHLCDTLAHARTRPRRGKFFIQFERTAFGYFWMGHYLVIYYRHNEPIMVRICKLPIEAN